MNTKVCVEDVKIGRGGATVNIGLEFDMIIGKNEMRPFLKWLKLNNLERISVGETPAYLAHWREGKELGLY